MPAPDFTPADGHAMHICAMAAQRGAHTVTYELATDDAPTRVIGEGFEVVCKDVGLFAVYVGGERVPGPQSTYDAVIDVLVGRGVL